MHFLGHGAASEVETGVGRLTGVRKAIRREQVRQAHDTGPGD